MAGIRAKGALQRCKQPMGTGGHCCHAAVLPTKVRLLMVQTFIYPRSYGAEVGHDEGGQRQDVSGRKESSPQHSSPIPEIALLTFCTGTLGYSTRWLIDAAKLCWQHRCQNMEAGRWPRGAAILIRG
jgi:hypothetical protein